MLRSVALLGLLSAVGAWLRIDPLVETQQGLIRGLRSENGKFSKFLGIPYALVDEKNPFGFAGCLIIIILLELSVGIAAAALRPQIEGTMKTQLRASFIKNKSTKEEDSTYREFWDKIQNNLECCGVTGPDNYGASEPRLNPSFSCCPPDDSDRAVEIKRSDCLSLEKYYKEGCEDKVLSTVHSAGMTVIVCGILFCFLEVAGIILALWLAHAIKSEGKSRETA